MLKYINCPKCNDNGSLPYSCKCSDDQNKININVEDLHKAAKCVFLVADKDIAQDIASKLNNAAYMINELRDFIIWMTGCDYDFCQHDYFCKKRDELLK